MLPHICSDVELGDGQVRRETEADSGLAGRLEAHDVIATDAELRSRYEGALHAVALDALREHIMQRIRGPDPRSRQTASGASVLLRPEIVSALPLATPW